MIFTINQDSRIYCITSRRIYPLILIHKKYAAPEKPLAQMIRTRKEVAVVDAQFVEEEPMGGFLDTEIPTQIFDRPGAAGAVL